MNKLLFFIISIFVSYSLTGQNIITYSYDSAGNRTTRDISEIDLALFPTYKSGIINYDNCSLKRESGNFSYAFETSIYLNTSASDKLTVEGCYKTHEWNNVDTLVNDYRLNTRRIFTRHHGLTPWHRKSFHVKEIEPSLF